MHRCGAVREPGHGQSDIYSSSSVDIAFKDTGGEDAEEIIRKAECALYRAKRRGGSRFEFYDASLDRGAIQKASSAGHCGLMPINEPRRPARYGSPGIPDDSPLEPLMTMKHDSIPVLRAAVLTAVPLAAMAPASTWAQQSGRYYGHMWDGGWHDWFFGPLMMVLLVALVVIGVVLAVRWSGGPGRDESAGAPADRRPLAILKERFARGEIDKDEFEERRRVLEE